MDWDCIYADALTTADKIDTNGSFTVDAVNAALERLNEVDISFLNAVGLFNYHRLVNQEELAYILPRIAGKTEDLIPFCTGLVSAFSSTITTGGTMACMSFLSIVKRTEFDTIRKGMVQDILRSIVSNPKAIPSIRNKIGSSLISSVLALAGGSAVFSGPFTYGDELRIAIECCIEELPEDSEILDLAKQLAELSEMKKKEPKTLFNIRFSEGIVDSIRKGIFYSSIEKDYSNRCQVKKLFSNAGISENEMMLLSMFCFSQTQEKEENRNFWPQFQRWFGFTERTCKLNSLRNACIKAFEGIQTIRTGNSTQYVQTSLMHSIISNRPMSKQNAYKLFEREFRHNGYVGHTRENIEYLIVELMESGSLSIPSETRNAYKYNPDQTVNFLIDQYGYYETKMLDFLGDDPVLENTSAHFAITDYIDQVISSICQDSQQSQRLRATAKEDRSKGDRFHSPFLSIEQNGFENWVVSICYGYYHLKDENLALAEEAKVMVDNNCVASLEVYDGEIVGERIPISFEWIGKKVSLVVGNETIDNPVYIPDNLLFDFTTHRIVSRRLMRNCRHYLLVANQKDFSFDDAIYSGKSSIPNMNVYDITLDEDNFILLNDGIVGISGDDTVGHDFLDSGGIAVDADIVTPDGAHIPIRSDWPKINIISEKGTSVIVNANGHSAEYIEDVCYELRDGSGRVYRKINVYEMFPNLKIVDFSVVVGGTRKLVERFYALRNFEYSLDNNVYSPEDKITVNDLSFDDMKIAFGQKHYIFPARYETLKFKLIDGNAIHITPPMFKFTFADGTPIGKYITAAELKGAGLVSACSSSLEKDLRICVENDEGNCGWLRKSKGRVWDCSAVLESNLYRSGLFHLVCHSQRTENEICSIFFGPTATDQSIRFHSNNHIRIGREDGVYFHCRLFGATDLSKLKLRICDTDGKIVDEFSSDTTDIYRRLTDDFPIGRYSLIIAEQYRSIRTGVSERIYSQPEMVFEGRPINGEIVITISNAVVAGENKSRNIEKSKIVFRGHVKRIPIKGSEIAVNGTFHISNQFSERDIDLWVNPCKATVNHIEGNVIGIAVVGKDGKLLRIDEKNFLNPSNPYGKLTNIRALYGSFAIKEHIV